MPRISLMRLVTTDLNCARIAPTEPDFGELSRAVGRPPPVFLPNHDDSMKMVRHGHKRVQIDMWPHLRCPQPFALDNLPEFAKSHLAIRYAAEERCASMRTYRHEIHPLLRVVEIPQPDRPSAMPFPIGFHLATPFTIAFWASHRLAPTSQTSLPSDPGNRGNLPA